MTPPPPDKYATHATPAPQKKFARFPDIPASGSAGGGLDPHHRRRHRPRLPNHLAVQLLNLSHILVRLEPAQAPAIQIPLLIANIAPRGGPAAILLR
ncbi:hypothetical protein V493_07620 [Pseudogymnoascus sp. VKM F-4281 (FW-2241)]|nr:hypothetical protein V493_07620 [Pseudogymnoascus sp. VKM F-4281 (FW-2241)]